ncbi:MAG: CoB--CoM heterodisulfide reductase subunit C [Candidatus Syntropharchaeales archaeon]
MEVIELKNADSDFPDLVKKFGGLNLSACYQCGTCSSDCPVSTEFFYRVRRIMRRTALGLKDKVLPEKDIWCCTTCFTCFDRCPQEVNPTDVIVALRRISAREGYTPQASRNTSANITKLGHAVPSLEDIEKKREDIGLPARPPTAASHPEAIDEIQKIVKKRGIAEIIRFNWDKMELEE